jgi:hypothetical protein
VDGPMTANFYNLPEDLTPEDAFALGLCEARYPRLLSGAMHTAGWELLQRFKSQGYQGVRDFYKLFPGDLESRAPDVSKSSHIQQMEEKYLPPEMLQKYGPKS